MIRHIKLGGLTLRVQNRSPVSGSDNAGEWEEGSLTIRVNPSHPRPAQYSTLLHEVIHAISDFCGLGLKERQVRGLEFGLCSLFRDNPEFAEELLKVLQDQKGGSEWPKKSI